ncbi:MAG: hypothetical protein IJI27_04155 [Oscillospiraceae bacterium]|nr:hypothetical protein [Oscillospiraceae bacterium]
MSNHPDVYRARRRGWGGVWRTVLTVIGILLFLALLLIYSFHKYIVYDKEGVHVLFPMFGERVTSEDAAAPSPTIYPAELVYDEPNYASLISSAGQDLEAMRGKYLTADSITPETLTAAAQQVAAAKGNTIVLQMKPPSGSLAWKSSVALAESFEVNGTREIAESIRDLKAEYHDMRFVAVVSACVDSLMAERYAAMALKTANGDPYADGSGGWVDPYSTSLREYLGSLSRELADMGFDEIAYSYMQLPDTTAELGFSAQMSTTPTPRDAVVSLAQYLRSAISDRGVELDVILSSDSALQGREGTTGQDLELMAKIFSRLCAFGEGDTLTTLKEKISGAAENFNLETRFVPFVRNAQIEGSWVMTG